jgi:hypothetical protein
MTKMNFKIIFLQSLDIPVNANRACRGIKKKKCSSACSVLEITCKIDFVLILYFFKAWTKWVTTCLCNSSKPLEIEILKKLGYKERSQCVDMHITRECCPLIVEGVMALGVKRSLDRTYYGTVMSVCLAVFPSVCLSVRSGFSTYNFIFLPHIKLKFVL